MIHLAKRFEAAVFELVGDGPIKQRLGRAYAHHLNHIHSDDLPETMRERYRSLHAALHRAAPIGKEGSLQVTVRKMSFAEASGYAARIVELYAEVVRAVEREPLKIVHSDEAPRDADQAHTVAPQRVSAGRP